MKAAFLVLMLIHGLIHLLGFVKAFHLANVGQLTQPVPRLAGILWLLTAIAFTASFGLLLLDSHLWWIVALIALVVSQILIGQSWTDAKFGSFANLIILIPIIVSLMNALPSSFQNRYRTEVQKRLGPNVEASPVSEDDIRHLPTPVQKYLHYVGAVGKQKVRNFRAVAGGSMKRTMESKWMDISCQQYNFFDEPARLFYIESAIFGIPFDGLHLYVGRSATMQIKVASLVQVVDARGEKMNQGETVTMFNDMCILAPATLIDTSIQWEPVDSLNARARFSNAGYTISASLSFNEQGALTSFISNDRFLSSDGNTYTSYPWSTPVREYRDFAGRKVPTYGEAIWHTPDGDYCYGKFTIQDIEYNCKEFK